MPTTKTRRVLIVEDDPQVAGFVGATLADAGYQTETVRNGMEALRVLGAAQYHLIVLDLCLPEMDGIEMLRAISGTGRTEKIIAITGSHPSVLAAAASLGADGILGKPFGARDLLAAVAALG